MDKKLIARLKEVNPWELLEFVLVHLVREEVSQSCDTAYLDVSPEGLRVIAGDVDGAPDARIPYSERVVIEVKINAEDWRDSRVFAQWTLTCRECGGECRRPGDGICPRCSGGW